MKKPSSKRSAAAHASTPVTNADAPPSSVLITAGDVLLHADLNASPTAQKIFDALPLEGPGTRWGGEIYFDIPIESPEEPAARMKVAVGEIGFWPPGNTFCIFFGLTPVSMSDHPMAYSPVNIIGTVRGDATRLVTVEDGAHMRVERAPKSPQTRAAK